MKNSVQNLLVLVVGPSFLWEPIPALLIFLFRRTPHHDTPGADALAVVAPIMRQGPCEVLNQNARIPINPARRQSFSGVGQGGVRTPPVRKMNRTGFIMMWMITKPNFEK